MARRKLAVLAGALAVVAAAGTAAWGAPPELERQFVYSLSPWTGTQYGGTFAARAAATFYLLADTDNLVNAARTDVYYWPITGEYMADWMGVREEVPGVLEISRDGEVRRLERRTYVYRYPQGLYAGPQHLLLDEEAQAAYEGYQQEQQAFFQAQREYYDAYRLWQERMSELLRQVQETGENVPPEEIPPAPQRPAPPAGYVTPPRRAFVVNLPAGEYRVRLLDEEGQAVPDSEKRLVVFQARREGVVYRIIPESKWTRPVFSYDLPEVLYLHGDRTLYLQPHAGSEYNQYQYTKLMELQRPLAGEGTRSRYVWAAGEALDDSYRLQVLRGGRVVQEVSRKPYYVRQTPGSALGYDIVEFDPADPALEGRNPTFQAFRLELAAGGGYELRVVDAEGDPVPGSQRQVRSVREEAGWALYGVPFLPLGLGLGLFGWRRGLARTARGEEPLPRTPPPAA